MIRDKAIELDTAFSIAGLTNYMITDVVDLQQSRTLGGEELFMVFHCIIPPATITTPRFQFWAAMANTANLQTNTVVLGATQMFGNVLTPDLPVTDSEFYVPLGAIIPAVLEPSLNLSRRYLGGVYYNGTEDPTNHNYTAGTFSVHVVQGIQTARLYHFPAGFGVL
jgi:hypothetical protein